MKILESSRTGSLHATIALFGAIAMLLSCSSTERLLVGTWERSSGGKSVVLTLHSDETFVAQIENEVLGGLLVDRGNVSGTWRVNDGRFIATATESTTGMVAVGHTWSDEIVEISESHLVLRPQSGAIEEYTRGESVEELPDER